MIRSTMRVGASALAAAAIVFSGLTVIGVGEASASGVDARCLATKTLPGRNSDLIICVTSTHEECEAWSADLRQATRGASPADNCARVRAGELWNHPAGYYGAVFTSK